MYDDIVMTMGVAMSIRLTDDAWSLVRSIELRKRQA